MTEQPDQLFDGDGEHHWLRRLGEPLSWHLRLMRFCRMGLGRSLLGLYNQERAERGLKPKLHVSGSFMERVVQFDWKRRAAAWDLHLEKRDRLEWEKRRREYRKREIEYAEALIKKANQMLQFPLATTEQTTQSEGGRTIITNVITATKWSIRDAALMIETADRLYRLALQLETTRTVTDVQVCDDIELIRQKRWDAIKDLLPSVLNQEGDQYQAELSDQDLQSVRITG